MHAARGPRRHGAHARQLHGGECHRPGRRPLHRGLGRRLRQHPADTVSVRDRAGGVVPHLRLHFVFAVRRAAGAAQGGREAFAGARDRQHPGHPRDLLPQRRHGGGTRPDRGLSAGARRRARPAGRCRRNALGRARGGVDVLALPVCPAERAVGALAAARHQHLRERRLLYRHRFAAAAPPDASWRSPAPAFRSASP